MALTRRILILFGVLFSPGSISSVVFVVHIHATLQAMKNTCAFVLFADAFCMLSFVRSWIEYFHPLVFLFTLKLGGKTSKSELQENYLQSVYCYCLLSHTVGLTTHSRLKNASYMSSD